MEKIQAQQNKAAAAAAEKTQEVKAPVASKPTAAAAEIREVQKERVWKETGNKMAVVKVTRGEKVEYLVEETIGGKVKVERFEQRKAAVAYYRADRRVENAVLAKAKEEAKKVEAAKKVETAKAEEKAAQAK